MTITRADVADLRPGDVVEYSGHPDMRGAKVTGPLRRDGGGRLWIADYVVRHGDGSPPNHHPVALSLTVVSRAPRPLYVNHDRTEPVPGDVVRDADNDSDTRSWWCDAPHKTTHPWLLPDGECCFNRSDRASLPARLRLLVDGETGMPPAVTQ